jgi:hypothetical protein
MLFGQAPPTPVLLETRVGDGSVIVRWQKVTTASAYAVYRAKGSGAFEQLGLYASNAFADVNGVNNETYRYKVRSVGANGLESPDSAVIEAQPHVLTDTEFLDLVQRTAFDYFWNEANPENGLIKDRSTNESPASIAAVGFGLSAITVAIDHGWLSREDGRKRVLNTLRFFWNAPQSATDVTATGYNGWFYHFLDMNTGKRVWQSELSTIDTALLMGGVLHARQYFTDTSADEMEIRTLSDQLYERINWAWILPRPPKIAMGWKPESGFLSNDWVGYNEGMILYILAMGAPKNSIGGLAWQFWTRGYAWQSHYGYSFLTFPPLFGHQYSHVWVDFRSRQDEYMRNQGSDYFENSRRATLAQRNYCIANPKKWADYSENVWGITASDIPNGYSAQGAPPDQNDNGTIAPTAAGGSFAFTPTESLAALREMYRKYKLKLWSIYGFKDAFNISKSWFDTDYIGIDQGPIILMIENQRTGKIWKAMMKHEGIQRGLDKAGFTGTGVANEAESANLSMNLTVFPNPSATSAQVLFNTIQTGNVVMRVYDLLGQEVVSRTSVLQQGAQTWILDTKHWTQGLYVVQIEQNGQRSTQNLIITR